MNQWFLRVGLGTTASQPRSALGSAQVLAGVNASIAAGRDLPCRPEVRQQAEGGDVV